jgi:hypothetical protein
MDGFVSAALATASVSAKTAGDKSGSSPRWIIARRAMALSSARLDIGGRFMGSLHSAVPSMAEGT